MRTKLVRAPTSLALGLITDAHKDHLSASYADVYEKDFWGKRQLSASELFKSVWAAASMKAEDARVRKHWAAVVAVCQTFREGRSSDEAAFVDALVGGMCRATFGIFRYLFV
jgi:hypothetical protein